MTEKFKFDSAEATEVSITAAKATWSSIIRRAEAGERIILTNHGRRVAEIGPIRSRSLTLDEIAMGRNQLAYTGSSVDGLIDEIRGPR